jgi:hypothetical protein
MNWKLLLYIVALAMVILGIILVVNSVFNPVPIDPTFKI